MSGHIRRARLEERPRISEIRFAVRENQLLDPSRVTDADYHWFSENPGIWVWEEDGHILGFSAADTRDGTIWALFIDPDHEGRGIGRALLRRPATCCARPAIAPPRSAPSPARAPTASIARPAGRRSSIDERGEQIFRLAL